MWNDVEVEDDNGDEGNLITSSTKTLNFDVLKSLNVTGEYNRLLQLIGISETSQQLVFSMIYGFETARHYSMKYLQPDATNKVDVWDLSTRANKLEIDTFTVFKSSVTFFNDMEKKYKAIISDTKLAGVHVIVAHLLEKLYIEHGLQQYRLVLFEGNEKEGVNQVYLSDRTEHHRYFLAVLVKSLQPDDVYSILQVEQLFHCIYRSNRFYPNYMCRRRQFYCPETKSRIFVDHTHTNLCPLLCACCFGHGLSFPCRASSGDGPRVCDKCLREYKNDACFKFHLAPRYGQKSRLAGKKSLCDYFVDKRKDDTKNETSEFDKLDELSILKKQKLAIEEKLTDLKNQKHGIEDELTTLKKQKRKIEDELGNKLEKQRRKIEEDGKNFVA